MSNEQTKSKTPATAPAKVKALPITGKITLTENNDKQFVLVIMDNPFPGEPLGELRLTFVNEGKVDRWGEIDDRAGEKRKGWFEFLARKYLKTNEQMGFKGAVTYQRWVTKQKEIVDFVSIDIDSPFPDFEDGSSVRVFFRKAENILPFEYLAKQRLELITSEGK